MKTTKFSGFETRDPNIEVSVFGLLTAKLASMDQNVINTPFSSLFSKIHRFPPLSAKSPSIHGSYGPN